MIFNYGLENYYKNKRKIWNLSHRNKVPSLSSSTNLSTDSRAAGFFSEKNFFEKIQTKGKYWQKNDSSINNITNNGFILTPTSGSYGIGIPYYCKAGQVIKIKGIVSGSTATHAYISVGEYGEDGVWIEGSTLEDQIVSVNGTALTATYTVLYDGWIMIILNSYATGVTVQWSNMSLSIQ